LRETVMLAFTDAERQRSLDVILDAPVVAATRLETLRLVSTSKGRRLCCCSLTMTLREATEAGTCRDRNMMKTMKETPMPDVTLCLGRRCRIEVENE
jgi:hypothetical protein